VGLVADGYRLGGAEATPTVINTAQPVLPTVSRRLFNGRPTPFVNGQLF
jgi:hypothetical protein